MGSRIAPLEHGYGGPAGREADEASVGVGGIGGLTRAFEPRSSTGAGKTVSIIIGREWTCGMRTAANAKRQSLTIRLYSDSLSATLGFSTTLVTS
jgi:hypothetical protein